MNVLTIPQQPTGFAAINLDEVAAVGFAKHACSPNPLLTVFLKGGGMIPVFAESYLILVEHVFGPSAAEAAGQTIAEYVHQVMPEED